MIKVEHFNIRIVEKGQRYGRDDCLVHDSENPLVEFYDDRQSKSTFGPRGQFVSRYFVNTLLERAGVHPQEGLLLDTGSPSWSISADGMQEVVTYLLGKTRCVIPMQTLIPMRWMPIQTAPKDNKRLLYLARIDEQGKLQEIDFDGVWEFWQESREMAHINGWAWCSANGIEEPTHWAFQDPLIPVL